VRELPDFRFRANRKRAYWTGGTKRIPPSGKRAQQEREYATMGRSSATRAPADGKASSITETRLIGRFSASRAPAGAKASSSTETRPRESHRDTVEAIVVALILALVVRGFEAQAFVIPTGSMAPTLMGRHKEIACPQCGFVYAVNASEEVEPRSYPRNVHSGLCVNCRYQARLDETPSFKGDRILVMMFPYDLPFLPGAKPPERWDVVVFRYPEEPEVSYIKRLVGLPGETIRIVHGDIYVLGPKSDRFALARKPLRHQSAMQITVYDDRRRAQAMAGKEEWARWRAQSGWTLDDPSPGRYKSQPLPEGRESELRYHHLVPDPQQWDAILSGDSLPRPPRETLVTDFYSYNTNMPADSSSLLGDPHPDQEGAWLQPHWVGDLTLLANLEISEIAPQASVRLELVKAGVAHRCTIDLSTGEATFTRGEDVVGRCDSPINGPGRYQIEFANVDERITLAVDGRTVLEEGFPYDVGDAIPIPTAADLAPVAIATRNATVVASDLVLKRDIYYTQDPGWIDYGVVWEDRRPRNPVELFDFLSDTSRFPSLGRVRSHEYEIGPDRFFMLGDNSPRSKDSRGWRNQDAEWDETNRRAWEVPRQLLTGKAFYVYWPHGVPFGPDLRLNRDTRLIFRPYVERMKWIR
jgi:signal peptidase I